MSQTSSLFLEHAQVQHPIICGAMYPCSNPELIAAVSEAGGLGVIQPLSLTYVHGYEIRAGIQKIKSLTSKPVGFNMLIEKSSKIYLDRMKYFLDVALEEGIRFFVTALGNPKWVVDRVEAVGGFVYHNTTEKRFAEKAIQSGVHGLICVNDRAGGHLGERSPERLYTELAGFGLPLVCAGGVSTRSDFQNALSLGYQAVQMGTRFIASTECSAAEDYKKAICAADESKIVATERVTGVALSVIRNEYVDRVGTKAGPIARFLLRNSKTKHWMRLYYSVALFMRLKKSNFRSNSTKDYWQAGKSVAGVHEIKSCAQIIREISSI